jgi:hypothetical protein
MIRLGQVNAYTSEEVEISDPVLDDAIIVVVGVEELGCCFGCDGTNLSVTARISRNKKDRNTVWLLSIIMFGNRYLH